MEIRSLQEKKETQLLKKSQIRMHIYREREGHRERERVIEIDRDVGLGPDSNRVVPVRASVSGRAVSDTG